jgi:DNA polymerase I-like protein with 3'-5' exonuclease and polymerase domains
LNKNTGIPEAVCKKFLDGLNKAFPGVVAWQNAVVAKARRLGYVRNLWGRKMKVDPARVFTQAPALEGQGGTTEIMKRAFIRMPDRIVRMIKVPIHDAAIFSIPLDTYEQDRATIVACMTDRLDPPGGQPIDFPVGYGKPGRNWREAEH